MVGWVGPRTKAHFPAAFVPQAHPGDGSGSRIKSEIGAVNRGLLERQD